MTNKKNSIDADPQKVGESAMNVLESILAMCDGGKTTTIQQVALSTNPFPADIGMSNDAHHKIQKAFMALEYFGLIKKKEGEANAYEPVPGAKDWYFDNKGQA